MSNSNALKLTKLRCWGRWKRRRPSAKRYTNSSLPLLARMGQVDFLWNYDDLNDLCWKSFNLQRAQADASGDGRLSYEELEAALQASVQSDRSDRSDKHYDIECDESTTAGAWRRSLVEGFGIGNPWCLVKFQDARPPRYMPGEALRAKWIEREKDSERERDGQHAATQQVPVKTFPLRKHTRSSACLMMIEMVKFHMMLGCVRQGPNLRTDRIRKAARHWDCKTKSWYWYDMIHGCTWRYMEAHDWCRSGQLQAAPRKSSFIAP